MNERLRGHSRKHFIAPSKPIPLEPLIASSVWGIYVILNSATGYIYIYVNTLCALYIRRPLSEGHHGCGDRLQFLISGSSCQNQLLISSCQL